jgi:cytochrome c peroxidase
MGCMRCAVVLSPLLCTGLLLLSARPSFSQRNDSDLDQTLTTLLEQQGFTGKVGLTLPARLGRSINRPLANLGRLIFFDKINGLHNDNSCAGCHSPAFGFGDTQSIAIGVDNNGVVGPSRKGPRNQRRAPMIINTAFLSRLMWNGRFFAPTGDPFDNSLGFVFPDPEGVTRFPPGDPEVTTLLAAQGHIPQTELVEMAGFTGTAGAIAPELDRFDNGIGDRLPPPDQSGFRNEPIREAVLARFNGTPLYRTLFGRIYSPVAEGAPITFAMIGQALAEFQISQTFMDAPIDRYARGDRSAMTPGQKKGAILFFTKARCVACHAVSGEAHELFSDLENYNIGVPQIAPVFGVATGNFLFNGPNQDEDFGREETTEDPADRYKFRTSPLRNVALQPTFFHNGCFTRIEDAIRHHLDVFYSARTYNPRLAGVALDLSTRLAPMEPVLATVHPLLATPIHLTVKEFEDLVAFVRDGLLDPRTLPRHLCKTIPKTVPSGMPVDEFSGCGADP